MLIEQEVLKVDDSIVEAQLTSNVTHLEQLLADGFRVVTPQGRIVTKAEDVRQYKSGFLKMKSVNVLNRTVTTYGNTAIVKLDVQMKGRAGSFDFSSSMKMTRAYAKISNDWKLVEGRVSEILNS